MTIEVGAVAISDTGPLMSMMQSDCFELVVALLGAVRTTPACVAELSAHGWSEAVAQASEGLIQEILTAVELERAAEFARQIAAQPATQNRDPDHHRGEAEVMALAQRADFQGAVLLVDERAAFTAARQAGIKVSGFAGVLLVAVEEGLLTANEVRARLERCRAYGTRYTPRLIEQVYRMAQEVEQ